MRQNQKISTDLKVSIVTSYLKGEKGVLQLCSEFNINSSSFYKWLNIFQISGPNGLITSHKNKYYPQYVKIQAVESYLDGKGSLRDICLKYQISDDRILRNWIKKYNGHETTNSQNSTGGVIMTTGRKTSFEERVEIVSFCISNNENYNLVSEKYQVSYQQAYTWTKKYKENGSEALADRRGQRKNPDNMSETEKLDAKVKLLEAENKRLQMENGFLKKLEEVERRRAGKTNI